MKSIHPEILARFDNMLKIRQLPFPVRPEYRKWLRYFLDFQAKYPQPGERSDQVRLFSEKLRSKGQTETQVRQAADAVSLFFASQQNAPVAPVSIRPSAAPHPVVSGAAEQPHTEDSVQSPGGTVSGMICEPTGLPVPDEHSTRRKGRFDDWVVLSRDEVQEVLARLGQPYQLIAKLQYGCGLRCFEAVKVRVKDFNFDAGLLTVKGKGGKSRAVPLPNRIAPELLAQLAFVKKLHADDLSADYAGVFLEDQLERKYPNAPREFQWQWFFPQESLTVVVSSGEKRRYHVHDSRFQDAMYLAVKRAQLTKRVTTHTLRHSFATHLLQANYDIRTIQTLLGHADVRTTMIYTHCVPSKTVKEMKSPLDF